MQLYRLIPDLRNVYNVRMQGKTNYALCTDVVIVCYTVDYGKSYAILMNRSLLKLLVPLDISAGITVVEVTNTLHVRRQSGSSKRYIIEF